MIWSHRHKCLPEGHMWVWIYWPHNFDDEKFYGEVRLWFLNTLGRRQVIKVKQNMSLFCWPECSFYQENVYEFIELLDLMSSIRWGWVKVYLNPWQKARNSKSQQRKSLLCWTGSCWWLKIYTSFDSFQFKDFLLLYNHISERCFNLCINGFNDRTISSDEVSGCMGVYVQHM